MTPCVPRPLVALVALLAVLTVRVVLDPILGDSLPFVTLFAAVAYAVWIAGYGTGIGIALVGYLASHFLFMEPRWTFDFTDDATVVGFATYVGSCALIIAVGHRMREAHFDAHARGEWLRVTLASIGDAVIAIDGRGSISFLNSAAEALTGWTRAEALGRPLLDVFRSVDGTTRRTLVTVPAGDAASEGHCTTAPTCSVIIARCGTERTVEHSVAAIRDPAGHTSGSVLVFRDISERRRLERSETEKLANARLLASIVDSSNDAIIAKSLDGTIRSWNAGAELVFGYTTEEAVGRHISLIIPPDRLQSEERHISACLSTGHRVDHFLTERIHKCGRRVLVSLTISPIVDEHGNVVGASKIARDVTLQCEAQERERQLLGEAAAVNAKFRAMFDQGAMFAAVLAPDGTILEASRLFWDGCGYAWKDIADRRLWDGPWWRSSPALAERVRAGTAEAAAGRPFRIETAYVTADGDERFVDLSIAPINDGLGRVQWLACTGTDVTERKRAESDRQKFVTLVENSTDFIGMCDLEFVPFYVNPAGRRMVGLETLEQARHTRVRDFFLPEDQSRIMEQFYPAVAKSGHAETEVRFRHFQTGETRWMAYKVLALNDADGRRIGYATVSQDVTDRRRLDEDLRTLAANLSEANRRQSEFLAMLAHELRNPLAPLSNTLAILRHVGGDAPALAPAIDMMERQLRQIVRLVDDLMDLSRITHDRLDLRKNHTELGTVIEQAVEACRPMAQVAGHAISVQLPRDPIYLEADHARLVQVFGNLLNNSCKYTAPGGSIGVTVDMEGDDVIVRVTDNGIGIPADKLESIFAMFEQVETSAAHAQGGLGIGLTLVKRLVQMHGGSVEANSAGPGMGAAVIVRLPTTRGNCQSATDSPSACDAPLPSQRILVVDDNKDAADSLAMLLQLDGHQIQTAHDGFEALKLIEGSRPDTVLLDIGLPGLDGYEVCRHIRDRWGRGIQVLAVTGWGQESDRQRSREAGFDGHLVKPVCYETLVQVLAPQVCE